MIISFSIVFVYMLIRYRKIGATKIIIDFLQKLVLTEAILLSIVAIIRFPVCDILINLFMILAVIELVYCILKSEKQTASIEIE